MTFERKIGMDPVLSRFISFLLFLSILSMLLISLLPSIINTDWGRRQAITWINHSIPGNIEIRQITLHWGKGQLIEGFLLKDPEGQSVLEFEKFSTEATLWQLIRKNLCLGFTQIKDLNAAIITDQKGETNLQRALGIEVSYATPPLSSSTIVLSDVNVESYFFVPNHPLSAQIKGLTRQDNLNGSFDINLTLNGLIPSDWEGFKENAQNYFSTNGSKEDSLQVRVTNFPVDLVDRLAALKSPHLNGLFHSLLGDRLNLNVDKEPSNEGLAFNLTLTSPLMQGDLKGVINKDVLSLKAPGVFHLNLIPQFVNPFTTAYFELLKPSHMEVIFSDLLFPLNFFGEDKINDPCFFGFNIELKIPETLFDVGSVGEINLLNLQAHLNGSKCDKSMQIEVIAQARQGVAPFDLHLTSVMNKPKNFFDLSKQAQESMRSTVTLSQLPLQIIPFFHKFPGTIEKFGPTLNVQLEIQPKNKEEWLGIFSFQTPKVILKEAQLSIGKEITLLHPIQFYWTMSPDCLQTFFNQSHLALEQPCHLNFNVKRFRMPLDVPQFTSFDLESSASQLRLTKLISWGNLQIDDFLLKIEGKNLGNFDSSITGKISISTFDGISSPLIPDPLAINHFSKWELGKEGLMEMTLGQLQLTNSITDVQIEAIFDSRHLLELTQPAQIQYSLSPAALQELEQIFKKKWPKLQENTSIKLTIDPTELNLKTFSLSNLYLQGTLQVKKIAFQNSLGESPILKDMLVSWVFDSPRQNIYTNLKGLAFTQKDAKPSQISALMEFWLQPGFYDFAHTKSEIRLNFSGMPTTTLNILFEMPELSPIIGPILDLSLKAFFDPTKEKPGYWDMAIDSKNLHTEIRLKLGEHAKLYDENKLPIFRLIVTPESYQQIKKLIGMEDNLQLSTSFTATGKISQFDIPIQDNLINQGAFDLKFTTTNLQWQDSSLPSWKLAARVFTENLKENIHFSAEVEGENLLKIKGALLQLFDKENHLNRWSEMGIEADLNGEQLPPPFFSKHFSIKFQSEKANRINIWRFVRCKFEYST